MNEMEYYVRTQTDREPCSCTTIHTEMALVDAFDLLEDGGREEVDAAADGGGHKRGWLLDEVHHLPCVLIHHRHAVVERLGARHLRHKHRADRARSRARCLPLALHRHLIAEDRRQVHVCQRAKQTHKRCEGCALNSLLSSNHIIPHATSPLITKM